AGPARQNRVSLREQRPVRQARPGGAGESREGIQPIEPPGAPVDRLPRNPAGRAGRDRRSLNRRARFTRRIAMTRPQQAAIVAYHSIADDHDHFVHHLSLSIALFERQLQYLQRNRFRTVTLYEVHEYLRSGAALPPNAIVLTFDDGYLDNWVHAFPL